MNSRIQKEQFPSLQVLQSEGLQGAAWASAPQNTLRLRGNRIWFSPESFPLKHRNVQQQNTEIADLAKTLPNIQVAEGLSHFLLAGGTTHNAILKRASELLEACKDAEISNGASANAIMKALFSHMEGCTERADFTEAVIALVSLSRKAHRGEGGLITEQGLNWSPNFGYLQTVFLDSIQTIEERTKMLQAAARLVTRGGLPAALTLSVLSCALTRASGVDSRFSETELGVLGILEKQAQALAQEAVKHQHDLQDTFFVHVNTVRKALGVAVETRRVPASKTTWHSAGERYHTAGPVWNCDPDKQGSTPGALTFKMDIGKIEQDPDDYRKIKHSLPLPLIFQYLDGGDKASAPVQRRMTMQVPANDKILPLNSPVRNAIEETGIPLHEIPVYISIIDIKGMAFDTLDFNRHFNLMSHMAIFETMHQYARRKELCGIFPLNDCVKPSGNENDVGFDTLKEIDFHFHDSHFLSGDIARFMMDPNQTGEFWAMTHDRHHNNVVLELFIVSNSGDLYFDILDIQNGNLSPIENIERLEKDGCDETKASIQAMLRWTRAALSTEE